MTVPDGFVPVDLRGDGLLWLINVTTFHPRGFALAVNDGEFWLQGDGTEPWRFASEADVIAEGGDPANAVPVDRLFDAVEAMFARVRRINAPADTVTPPVAARFPTTLPVVPVIDEAYDSGTSAEQAADLRAEIGEGDDGS